MFMQIYATGMIHGCETCSNLRQSEAEAVITFASALSPTDIGALAREAKISARLKAADD